MDSKFCHTCDISTKALGPVLVPVPRDNETYGNVANQFQMSWRHPTPCPKVQAIYKVVEKQDVLDRYNKHRATVETRGRFASHNQPSGNQQRRWHGTNRECGLGENGRTSFCYSPRCSLCCIIRTSFDLSHARKKTGWGRFGCGIYTSSTSSKSNDYSTNLVPSPWKAILLSYVVVGKAMEYKTDRPSLMQPPAGFDSVIGKPSATGTLNYDEVVVYNNDAVCPAYMVMYSS